jgi:asparagine synthase (glutamine-hydrolysing)
MCGIVGIISNNGQFNNAALLKHMADAISHRGPDEEGSLLEGAVGLYHKRLSIIDLSAGKQPMTHDGITIVFNGEIYNYVELREELKKNGRQFLTNSDTEVIIRMYQEHGLECFARLNGMFAFLLYDRRRNRIVGARDHFGIKPLYYHVGKDCTLFASEIKALLRHPALRAEPDFDSIHEYLTLQYVLDNDTMFKGINKVPPGHFFDLDLDTRKFESKKYWGPDFTVDTFHTQEYFVYQLQHLLEDAVKIQLRSDVPLGAYLSGGMDSSLVAILASSNSGSRLATFTGAFSEGPQFDETPYAREVAESISATMHEVYPTEQEFIDLLPKLIYHMDEPAAGPGLFPQYMVSRLAAQHVKVVLGGQGGDEIFGGYARYVIAYFEQAIKGAIFESVEEGEHIVSLKSVLPNLPYLRQYAPMMQHFWKNGLFEDMDHRYFRLINRSEGDCDLFTGEFCRSSNTDRIFHRFQKAFNNPNTLSYYNKMVNYDMTCGLPALLQVEDRMSMAVSIESRVPLLDRRIVDLVTTIPPAMKFQGAEMKFILKRAFGNRLPPSILNRKDKMGFPVPLHLWAKNKAKGFFQDVLLSQSCRQRGLFNTSEVERLIQDESAFGRRLWGLVNLELWFKTFIN